MTDKLRILNPEDGDSWKAKIQRESVFVGSLPVGALWIMPVRTGTSVLHRLVDGAGRSRASTVAIFHGKDSWGNAREYAEFKSRIELPRH